MTFVNVRKLIPAVAALLLIADVSFSPAQTADYDQPFRPQVHFSPREHWTNDPNGLIFFHGEYHLFFQYNPFGDEWGHMSWGHAVSKDLLHWQQLPVAIPEEHGVAIFTGSVVIDNANTSGLCVAHTPCLVAIYTGDHETATEHTQTQNLAVSHDNGRTWTKYPANPVLDLHMADFRDPSVFWDEKERHWLMAVSLPKQHKVRFYSSPDLKRWTEVSEFGPAGNIAGDWECPDLLRVPAADGRSGNMWALKVGLNPGAPQGGSGEQYFLGGFDGKTFQPAADGGAHGWTNYGKDDYCAISYNGLPAAHKPVLIGWMNNWQYAAKLPTAPWRGQMSLPREISWKRDAAGLALVQQPIVAPLRIPGTRMPITPGNEQGDHQSNNAPIELQMEFQNPREKVFGVRIYSDQEHWTEIGFDREKNELYIDRIHSGIDIAPGFAVRSVAPIIASRPYDLHLIVDRSSVEVYAQGGTVAMTDLIFPPSKSARIEIFPQTAKRSVKGDSYRLQPIWK